jgi:uncharacterized protein YbaA (DUF1428 family)
MAYIDGFILAVPHANKQTYIGMETKFGPLFKRFGATSFVVAWGDDVAVGTLTSFPRAVQMAERMWCSAGSHGRIKPRATRVMPPLWRTR